MNEPDILNNKYQLHMAMEDARKVIPEVFSEFSKLSEREYQFTESYKTDDAEVILFLLGSSYHTAKMAVDILREQGKSVGVFTSNVLRPFPAKQLAQKCKNAKTIIVGDRQDSYGANGGNMTLEIKAMLQDAKLDTRVISRIYGLGGRDFYVEDAIEFLEAGLDSHSKSFDYKGIYPGDMSTPNTQYFNPITDEESSPGLTTCKWNDDKQNMEVSGGRINETTKCQKDLLRSWSVSRLRNTGECQFTSERYRRKRCTAVPYGLRHGCYNRISKDFF